jgi:hypothetical protein
MAAVGASVEVVTAAGEGVAAGGLSEVIAVIIGYLVLAGACFRSVPQVGGWRLVLAGACFRSVPQVGQICIDSRHESAYGTSFRPTSTASMSLLLLLVASR